MIKLYKASRDVQIQWMRDNPGKTIAINVIFAAAVFGYIAYQDRRDRREFEENYTPQED